MPHAAIIQQFVCCDWTIGTSGDGEGTDCRFYIRNTGGGPSKLFSSILWGATQQGSGEDRYTDEGHVFDISRLVLEGTELQILYRQWKGPNQNNNTVHSGIIGQWLRED